MKHFIIVIGFLFATNLTHAQAYKVKEFDDLHTVLKTTNDTLYVINFWVNWAKECEKDLPVFDELQKTYADRKLKVLLVGIDVEEDLDKWVKPFLKEMQLQSEVWWLDMENLHELKRRKIDANWTVEAPFTIIRRGSNGERYWKNGKWGKKKLFEKIEEVL